MTLEEFNKTRFTGNMQCMFKGKVRDIFSINFDQALIGLVEICLGSDEGDIEWVRCENITIVSD